MISKALKAFKLCWPAYNMGFAKCGLQNIKSAVGFQLNICKLALRFANLRPTELTEHRVPQIAKPRALCVMRMARLFSSNQYRMICRVFRKLDPNYEWTCSIFKRHFKTL